MISVDNLSKSFGSQTLFEGISFKVNPREKVGVVARNGHGKTTLFRILTGEEDADSGSILKPRNYRIGYVEQLLDFKEDTVIKEAALAIPPGAVNEMWRVEKIMAGLGFGPDDLGKNPYELSGGYQVRLNLAKALLGDNQMLLLDEPTNFLDIMSIRWLEEFLRNWQGEVMLITHDRSFMDRVATHILGIHRKKARKIKGDTEKYYAQVASDEEVYEKTRVNDERRRRDAEIFITRFRSKARLAGLVQSRIKSIEKMKKKERLEEIKDLEFTFTVKPFYHRYAMDIKDLSFAYEDGQPLIKDFSLSVGARERVFIIGRNGRGKTTLMKLMAGALKPTSGNLAQPMSVEVGYFEQTHVASLHDDRTVVDEIYAADPDGDPKKARSIAAAMMFEGDDALKPIRILSGGERSRVLLGRLISTPVNLLLLDEPTNHLDIQSNDALIEALDNFDGAVVMVTHNEMFLHALAERLVIFEEDGISVFEGGYQSFLDRVGWKDEKDRVPRTGKAESAGRQNQKEIRRRRSELIAAKSRTMKPIETRMKELERLAEKRDIDMQALNKELIVASNRQDGHAVVELSKSLHQAKKDVDDMLDELEHLSNELEKLKTAHDLKLKEFDEALAPDGTYGK